MTKHNSTNPLESLYVHSKGSLGFHSALSRTNFLKWYLDYKNQIES